MFKSYFSDSGDLTIPFRDLNSHSLEIFNLVRLLEEALQAKGEEEQCSN
jgi:hypothetical protein